MDGVKLGKLNIVLIK